jgi:NADH:ubiquinone oxidoreductase subunit 2 (subunit N)
MSIPIAPTLLLAFGGVMLIFGRWVRLARIFQFLWLGGLTAAIWSLATTSRALPPVADEVTQFVWATDTLGLAGQVLSLLLGALFGLGSFGVHSPDDRPAERFGFLSFQTAGLMLVAIAADCITLAMAMEVVQFASMALRRVDRLECHISRTDSASLLNEERHGLAIVSSLCLWLGIALLCEMTGSTQYEQIRRVLLDGYQPGPNRVAIGAGSRLGLVAIGLIVCGLAGRIGFVPWHLVLVNAGQGVRYWTAGNAILSGQLAGLLGLSRLCGTVWVGYRDEVIVLLMATAALTFLVAGCQSLHGLSRGEGRVSGWLLSLTMLNGAWLAIGLIAASADLHASEQGLSASPGQPGSLGVLFFSTAAGLIALTGQFLLLSSLSRNDRDLMFVDELLGLFQLSPVAAAALLTLFASLIGQPPLWGFWDKFMLAAAGLNVRAAGSRDDAIPQAGMIVLLVVALMGTLIIAGVVVRIARVILLEMPVSQSRPSGRRSGFLVGCFCVLVVAAVGVAPAQFLALLTEIRGPVSPAAPESPQGKGRGEATAFSFANDNILRMESCAR